MVARAPAGTQWGLLERTSKCGDGTWPVFADVFKTLARTKWQSTSFRQFVWHVFSQLDGHCTANAAAQALMLQREFQGLPRIVLAPHSLYMQHSVWGTGSTLDANLRHIRDYGVLTEATFPQSKARRGEYPPNQWPKELRDEAKRYRVLEWFDLNGSFDAVATAVMLRFPAIIGVNWPGGGGHAIAVTGLVRSGNGWSLEGPNSWSAAWGDKGFWRLTESQCRSMERFGAWCCRSAVVPS